jgi:hypothetical protein
MENVTDNGAVPSALSEEELQRLVAYFSILHEWSLQCSNLNDRYDGILTPRATTSVDATKPPSVTGDHLGH